MSKPTEEQIAKLPKWAQEHIRTLEQQRREVVGVLEDFTQAHATGPVRCRMMVSDGEAERGPSHREVRFDARWIEIEHVGVHLGITLAHDEIRLAYTTAGRSSGCVYLKPTSFQQFTLKAKLEH